MRIRFNVEENRLEIQLPGKAHEAGAVFTAGRYFEFPSAPEFGRQAQIRLDDDGFVREVHVTGLASIVGEFMGPRARAATAKKA